VHIINAIKIQVFNYTSCALTTIRKVVSPISAFAQGEALVKGKHGFFIIRSGRTEQAKEATVLVLVY
jgi:hypothetical protein